MTPAEFFVELARPLKDTTILVGLLAFTGLGLLAAAAGPFGFWLLIVIVPALGKFLVNVMLAQIDRRPVEPAGIELFNYVHEVWRLLPLVLLVAAILWSNLLYTSVAPAAGLALGATCLLVLPASFGVLGLTHSPVAALNPLLLADLVRRCGFAYLAIPLSGILVGLAVGLLAGNGIVQQFVEVFGLGLLFSMTGTVVAASGAREEVGIPDAVEPTVEHKQAVIERERSAVLNHAYGLFSRGNSDGGLKHISDFIDRSPDFVDKIEEFERIFQRMIDWEDTGPGLLVGQRYLSTLLQAGESRRALKILSRCLLAEPRFRPLPDDRARVVSLAESAGREDILDQLR